MAPHPIAEVQDVLYAIFSYLDPDLQAGGSDVDPELQSDETRSTRNTLALLARAHRLFTWPAVTVLWRSLPSDIPLKELANMHEIGKLLSAHCEGCKAGCCLVSSNAAHTLPDPYSRTRIHV